MKHFTLAMALAALTTPAFAGAVSDPVVEPKVSPAMVESSATGNDSWVVPLMTIILFATALG